MKSKRLKELAGRLLHELPGFAMKGTLSFVHPIGHTLRGLHFEVSEFDSRLFFVNVFVQPLFVPAEEVALNVGWRLGGGRHRWDLAAEDVVVELVAALNSEAVPFLGRITTPRDVAEAARSLHRQADPYVQQAIAYSLARGGQVPEAVGGLEKLVRSLDHEGAYGWQTEMAVRARTLKAELLADQVRAQRRLETWEDQTAENLDLARYR